MIDPKFSGIVYTFSILAAIGGLLFGIVPGSDIPILLILWAIGIGTIINVSGAADEFSEHWFRHIIVLAFVYVIFSTGTEVVHTLTLPVFYIVNPLLDGIATYRILRASAKLYARKDLEEVTSSTFTVLWSMARDAAVLFGAFFGLDD